MSDKLPKTFRSARRIGHILFLAVFFSLPVLSPAAAAQGYKVLSESALTINDPSHVVLISIGRAGNRLVAVGEQGVIIYSDDSGKSWKQASVPVDVTITALGFATPEDGWAAGDFGVVLHTVDGGRTWSRQLTGVEVNQLQTRSANRLEAADPNDPDSQRAVRRASILAAAGPDKPFFSIQAFSPEHAIIFGAYRMTVMTEDGGKSWIDLSLNVADPLSHNLYESLRAGSAIYIAGEAGMIFRSRPDDQSFTALESPTTTTLLGILQPAPNTLLVFGVAGAMFRSTDGGQNWTSVDIPEQADLTSGVVLKSGLDVVTSENGDLFVSSDQGADFVSSPTRLGMSLFGVTQAPDGDLVFVGTDGIRVLPASSLKKS